MGRRIALAMTAAGFAFMGQYLLSNSTTIPIDGLTLYGLAIAAFLPLAWTYGSEGRPSAGKVPVPRRTFVLTITTSPIRAALVLLALGLAYTTLRLIQGRSSSASYLDTALLWAGGAIAYTAAFAPATRPNVSQWLWKYRMELLLLAGVTCVAAALRFVDLGTIPASVSGDEGAIGNLALSAVHGEINSPFETRGGRGTLYLMIIGLPMRILGPNTFSLRVVSALVGVLAVVATYLLARHLFGSRVAFVSAALVAVSHIHIHLSRISDSGAIIDSLFAPLALYFLIRAVDNGRPIDYLLGGFTVALHLYLYNGGKLMVIVFFAYLVVMTAMDRRRMLANMGNLLVLAGAFLIVAGPMLNWALIHPDQFMDRSNQVGIFPTGWLAQEAARTGRPQGLVLLDQFYKAMMAFIYYPAEAFYGARIPMFDIVVAVPFVLGLAHSIAHTVDRRFLLLNVMFFLTGGFGQVALVEPEHDVYRILVIVPIAAIMAAVALHKLLEQGVGINVRGQSLPAIIIALFLLTASVTNINYYFREWAGSGSYPDPATRQAFVMGRYLGTLDRDYKAYLFGTDSFKYGIHPSVDFLSGKMPVMNVSQPLAGGLSFVDRTHSAVFIFVPQRENELSVVRQYFPGGTRRELLDSDNWANTKPVLITYEVPRGH